MQNLEQKLSLRNERIILGLLTLASILSWQSPLAAGCRSGDAPISLQTGESCTNKIGYYWSWVSYDINGKTYPSEICCGPKK